MESKQEGECINSESKSEETIGFVRDQQEVGGEGWCNWLERGLTSSNGYLD